jgi:hypothetical protein
MFVCEALLRERVLYEGLWVCEKDRDLQSAEGVLWALLRVCEERAQLWEHREDAERMLQV